MKANQRVKKNLKVSGSLINFFLGLLLFGNGLGNIFAINSHQAVAISNIEAILVMCGGILFWSISALFWVNQERFIWLKIVILILALILTLYVIIDMNVGWIFVVLSLLGLVNAILLELNLL